MQTQKDDFTAKVSAAQSGGPADTAANNNARQALLGSLRQQALYVQITCDGDISQLLSSGFEAQSTNRDSVPLDKPEALVIKNGTSGQLVASVGPVKNTSMYEGRIKLDDAAAAWLPSIFTSDSQHIIFNG